MQAWKQTIRNHHLLAERLCDRVRTIRDSLNPDSLTEFTREWIKERTENVPEEKDLKEAYRVPNLPSPVEMQVEFVLAKLKFHVPEDFNLNVAQGFCGDQEHKWLELWYEDLTVGPLPRVYIIDPATRSVDPPCLLIGPDSPYRLLYKGNVRSELGG